MKKMLSLMLFLTVLIGCKSTSPVSTKLDNKSERALKGSWTITSIDYAGSDYINIKSFNLEDSKCFVGSQWTLISNNNKGDMKLNNSSTNCKDFSSPITWYINKDDNFVLKIINDYKAKTVNTGYVLTLQNITDTSFQLIDKINVAGSLKNVTYTFQKQQ